MLSPSVAAIVATTMIQEAAVRARNMPGSSPAEESSRRARDARILQQQGRRRPPSIRSAPPHSATDREWSGS